MPGVDKAWLDRLIGDVQELSVAVATHEQRDLPAVVREFTERLAPAPDSLHQALLANLLLDVCRHTFDSLHASIEPESCTCAAKGWALLARFTRWYEVDPRVALCTWTETFFAAYRHNHPPTPATRAAAMMRTEPERPWTIASIARALGVTRRQLSTEFRERYGFGPLEYVHLARVAQSLMLLDDPIKIEALAMSVGFRSKKDFYRAFRTWTGMIPTAVRTLPGDARRMLTASLRARCLWGDRIRHQASQDGIRRGPMPIPLERYGLEYDASARAAAS
jgi:AraC-like DNA-binding protein